VTYPKAVREASGKILDAASGVRGTLEAALASGDAAAASRARADLAALDKAVQKARDDLARVKGQERSLLGLEQPLFELRNPGIVSIPLGFLAVLLGSLLFRDRRSAELWPEVYVRQNTGILASKATSH
jgi:cation/acetate symporter